MTNRTAEAVVIGAGVIGASVAFHLARGGLRPIVVDRSDPAAGSSGACDGLVFLQTKKPGVHLELALASRRRFAELAAQLGPGIEFRPTGGMCLIESAAELAASRRFVALQAQSGLAVELVDGREARRREPGLSAAVLAATCCPDDAQVNPYGLAFAFLREARAAGAELLAGEAVCGIETEKGRVCAVRTSRRRIATPRVVNAAGAHAAEIGRLAGLAIPIVPRRGQILVTAARPPLVRHALVSAQYIAAKFDPQLAAGGRMGFSVEQAASGNLLLGSTREFAGFDRRTTFAGIRAVAARVAAVLPALAAVPVIRTFAGLRPYTPDGLPIIGEAPGLAGFFIAAGHEGDGIALAPITGELVAAALTGGRPRFSLEPFRLERFGKEAGCGG
jgi:sarcosine oxidase subunit beta